MSKRTLSTLLRNESLSYWNNVSIRNFNKNKYLPSISKTDSIHWNCKEESNHPTPFRNYLNEKDEDKSGMIPMPKVSFKRPGASNDEDVSMAYVPKKFDENNFLVIDNQFSDGEEEDSVFKKKEAVKVEPISQKFSENSPTFLPSGSSNENKNLFSEEISQPKEESKKEEVQSEVQSESSPIYVPFEKPSVVPISKRCKRTFDPKNSKPMKKVRSGREVVSGKLPSRLHLNIERKKHRIQFQKDHSKTVYSYVDMEDPIDFEEMFDMIEEHQEKNNYGFKRGNKSFHFIRDVDGQIRLVKLGEKRFIKALKKRAEYEARRKKNLK